MSEAQIEAEVHKADPAVRLGTFVALPLAAAAVAWAWHLFRGYLDALVVNSTGQLVESAGRVADLLVWVLLGGAFLLALLAAFWGRLARRIVAAGRYPFAGARLFHDMRILRGDAAAGYARRTARNAWLALALSFAALLGAVLLPGYLQRLHPVLAQGHVVFHFVEKGPKP